MARFVKHVRVGEVASPAQRKYKSKAWREAFGHQGDGSPEDQALYASGLAVYEHLEAIRDAATRFVLPLPPRTLTRLFCAVVNRVQWWITRRLQHRLAETSELTGVLNIDAADEQLFRDCYGNFASTDASIELAVDGVSVPLRLAMRGRLGKGVIPDDLEVIRRLLVHVRLGQTYTEIESLWQACVWEGCHVKQNEHADIYIPDTRRWSYASAVGQYRHDHLGLQDTQTAASVLKDLPEVAWRRLQRKKVLKAVGKSSPFRVTEIPPEGQGVESLLKDRTLLGRLVSRALYMEPLLGNPLSGLEGLSVDNILEVWSVLQPLADRLQAQFQQPEPISTIEEMLDFAPTISRSSLEAAVARATNLSRPLARRVVKLLTFTGASEDNLWLQPLVRTSQEELVVVTSPLLSINILWLIELLLAKGGADLDARGPEFETFVRNEIGEHASKGPLDAEVFPDDFRLVGNPVESSQPAEEQIDLLLRVGSVIVVGEVKCQLFPNTAANRRYNYRQTLKGAAHQARRKASFVEKNKTQFLTRMGWLDHMDPDSLSFYPLVITNVSLGVGFAIEGVPVADIRVVGQFLEQGTALRNVMLRPDGEVLSADVEPLYKSPADAPQELVSYLLHPPQISILEQYVRVDKRQLGVPLPSGEAEKAVFSVYPTVRTTDKGFVLPEENALQEEANQALNAEFHGARVV